MNQRNQVDSIDDCLIVTIFNCQSSFAWYVCSLYTVVKDTIQRCYVLLSQHSEVKEVNRTNFKIK